MEFRNIFCIGSGPLAAHADKTVEKLSLSTSLDSIVYPSTKKEAILSQSHPPDSSFSVAQHAFLTSYPQYKAPALDALRATEFKRINSLVYLDYTGATLYPECLIRDSAERLTSNVFGNPHSSNPPSQLASQYTEAARKSVLYFLDADPDVYTVVWTSNASSAMRIVGEGYHWTDTAQLLIGEDSHNSMNGLRAFALTAGATVDYYRISATGGNKETTAILDKLSQRRPRSPTPFPGIFCLTGQSNITGFKAPLHLIQHAAREGFHTLLDAAALAPTTPISLCYLQNTVDAMVISIYKIVGFPTGIGALVIKKSFLDQLRKPWFAGGTVDVTQVPGEAYTLVDGSPRFEDGTINFLSLPAIPRGLALVSALIPLLSPRLAALTHWTSRKLAHIKHPGTGRPLVHVRSPSPTMTLSSLSHSHGALIAFEVTNASGKFVSCDVIEYGAGKSGICLRAGCMCNPGGMSCLAGMGHLMGEVKSGDRKEDLVARYGVRSRGMVRASFGMGSNFEDAWTFVKFMESLTFKNALEQLLTEWDTKLAH